jgi:hypothetical protein
MARRLRRYIASARCAVSKPRWRINSDGRPEPVIDWDAIHAMEPDDQIPHMKELIKEYGGYLINTKEFSQWLNREMQQRIIVWHKLRNM